MFTGIIECTGIIKQIKNEGTNRIFFINSPISSGLKIDQSVSHDGVCLTVEEINGDIHRVTAIEETLRRTNLSQLTVGSIINLEQCMIMNGRLDGHIVQGHVDCTGTCINIEQKEGSFEFCFQYPTAYSALLIEKGSIAINGTSLTCFDLKNDSFRVAIIPYTMAHTSIGRLKPSDLVNLEFDVLGKYILRQREISSGK